MMTRTERERDKKERKERKRERDWKPCLNKSSVLSTLILFISFHFTSSAKYLHCLPPCQPVNIIQPSAGNTFQSPSDDRSCQSPSELQIQAIWEHSRHLFIELQPTALQNSVSLSNSLPSLEESERAQPLSDGVCTPARVTSYAGWFGHM